jgi:hypothetical protein
VKNLIASELNKGFSAKGPAKKQLEEETQPIKLKRKVSKGIRTDPAERQRSPRRHQ